MNKRFPEDTSVKFNHLPALGTVLALNRGEPSKAIELLRIATRYELGAPRSIFGALYPTYVRGLAYVAAHHGNQAAAEFQKILDLLASFPLFSTKLLLPFQRHTNLKPSPPALWVHNQVGYEYHEQFPNGPVHAKANEPTTAFACNKSWLRSCE